MTMTRGLAGIVSDPGIDPRVRRALGRFSKPYLLVTGTGVYIDDTGKIALRLNGTTLSQTADGLRINPDGSSVVAGLTVTNVIVMAAAGITITDAIHVALGSTTGTKIGTATTQKLGFWGVTPVVQPASADQADITLGNADGEIAGVGFTTTNTFTTTTLTFNNLSIGLSYDQTEMDNFRLACDVLATDCINLRSVVAARKTECESLRAKCEELADDVRNLVTLVRSLRTADISVGLIKGSA